MTNVITVFLSGLFGLAVAVVTFWLSAQREKQSAQRTAQKERYAKIENLYVDKIALLEKLIRNVEAGNGADGLVDDLCRLNARLELTAPQQILDQSEKLSELVQAWSSEHFQGMPQRAGNSGMAFISSGQTPHREKASAIYPEVIKETLHLIKLMKSHLQEISLEK